MKLAAALLTGALMTTGLAAETSGVNSTLASLGDDLTKLSEVDYVELCETKGAEQGVIHIRQVHYTPPDDHVALIRYGRPEDREPAALMMHQLYKGVNDAQREIHGLLTWLGDRGYDDIWSESYTEEEAAKGELGYTNSYYSALFDLKEAGYFAGHPLANIYLSRMWSELSLKHAHERLTMDGVNRHRMQLRLADALHPSIGPSEDFMYIPGADFLLAVEGTYSHHATTNNRLEMRVNETADRPIRTAADNRLIYDEREDLAIRYIGRASPEYAVLVYGGDHAFGGIESCGADLYGTTPMKDNIASWNETNPHRKLSLLVVTPTEHDRIANSESERVAKFNEYVKRGREWHRAQLAAQEEE